MLPMPPSSESTSRAPIGGGILEPKRCNEFPYFTFRALSRILVSMRRSGIIEIPMALLLFVTGNCSSLGQRTNEAPEFKEVYALVRAHVAEISEKELNLAAVKGLVSALNPRVSFLTNTVETNTVEAPLVSKSS